MLIGMTVFALAGAPYVAFLSAQTGHFRVEGKSAVNFATGIRVMSGMSLNQANYGVSEDLLEGPLLNPNWYFDHSPYRQTPAALGALLLYNARKSFRYALHTLALSPKIGAFVLLPLGVAGVFRRPRNRRRTAEELFMLAALACMSLTLLPISYFQMRFLCQFIPLLIIFAASGAALLYDLVAGLAARRRLPFPRFGAACFAITTLLACAMVVVGLLDLRGVRARHLPKRTAGEWLAAHQGAGAAIMAPDPIIPYYAGGVWLPAPSTDADLALRYIVSKQPRFLVLIEGKANYAPYFGRWLAGNLPDKRAHLVYRTPEATSERIAIYRWEWGG
jgi:hypothetical protein